MTDCELLELAAKAAGIDLDKSPYNGGGHGNTGFDVMGNAVLDWHNGKTWNPLADDGDALRLAVKLGIQPVPADDRCEARWWGGPLGTTQDSVSVITNSDRYIATRRAIVLAAAEIGKAVQKPLAP